MSRKDLPSITSANYLQRTREAMQTYLGRQGDPLDRGITLRDLVDGGIARLLRTPRPGEDSLPIEGIGGGSPLPGPPGPPGPPGGVIDPDLTPPPTPTGFTASGLISHVMVEHDAPIYSQGHGHLRTRLYGATRAPTDPAPTFLDAVEISQFSGVVHAHPSNPATIWHLWIKWETNDGVLSASPAGGANGIEVRTGDDVSTMVQAMTGPGNPFVILTAPTLIGGYTYPAGTYSVASFILDAQITNAKIANAAIDDAKIASVSVGKLLAGSIGVGEYIQSTGYVPGSAGWRINGNGTAEFSAVVVRGTIYASAGQIGGITIGSNYIRSSAYALGSSGWNLNADGTGQIGGITLMHTAMRSWNFSYGGAGWELHSDGTFTANSGMFRGNLHGGQFTTGDYTGFGWPASGGVGSYLGPSGLLLGNYNDGKYLQVTETGNFYAPGLTILNGVMTISQANVIDTLNIASDAVTVPVGASASNTVNASSGTPAISVAIDSRSAPVIVTGMIRVAPYATGYSVALRRNGTTLLTIGGVFPPAEAGFVVVPFSFFDASPGAGANTYSIYVLIDGVGPQYNLRSISCLGARR